MGGHSFLEENLLVPEIKQQVSCIGRKIFSVQATGEAHDALHVGGCDKSLQSCPVLFNLMDHSPPGSSVCGILQARILEWVAMPSSRGSLKPRDRTCVSCFLRWQIAYLPLAPPGNT